MLTLNNNLSAFDVALNDAGAVNLVEGVIDNILRNAKRNAAYMLVGVFAVPLSYLAGIWMMRKRAYFKNFMKTTPLNYSNADEYRCFREHIEKMEQFNDLLIKVSSYDLKVVPRLFRFSAKQLKNMGSTLMTYHSWHKSRLDMYNKPQFAKETKTFSFKSERDLWESRNKNYSYWM